MIYYPDSVIDQLLLEDVYQGDLTTRVLGIGDHTGVITFSLKNKGRVSGVGLVCKVLKKLDLELEYAVPDGNDQVAGAELIRAAGKACALHQGWKVCQNILEWSCGVAEYMAQMLAAARKFNSGIQIVCTRKSIPGTKLTALEAILHGGGQIHRCGTAETVLLFANHRAFWAEPSDWAGQVAVLRQNAPEKKIIVEADHMADVISILQAGPDVVQLDKFTPVEIKQVLDLTHRDYPQIQISAAGGINKDNVEAYAQTGVHMLVTSSAYYAKPADVKVAIRPA